MYHVLIPKCINTLLTLKYLLNMTIFTKNNRLINAVKNICSLLVHIISEELTCCKR